jgi:plastocyanin
MKKLVPLFALLLAAMALAACGGGSDTTSDEAAPAETTQEAETEKEAEGGSAGSAALDVEADPSGQLAFTSDEASAKAGKVTVNFTNSSPVPHDVKIEDSSGKEVGGTEVISEGSDSAEVELKPGTYTYYCSIPGHREAGMEGTLTVK